MVLARKYPLLVCPACIFFLGAIEDFEWNMEGLGENLKICGH